MEIAVIYKDDLHDITRDNRFKNLKILERHEGQVAGYVPIDEIQELFERLINLDRGRKIKKYMYYMYK
jgi:hypothetical protein